MTATRARTICKYPDTTLRPVKSGDEAAHLPRPCYAVERPRDNPIGFVWRQPYEPDRPWVCETSDGEARINDGWKYRRDAVAYIETLSDDRALDDEQAIETRLRGLNQQIELEWRRRNQRASADRDRHHLVTRLDALGRCLRAVRTAEATRDGAPQAPPKPRPGQAAVSR